MNWADDFSFAAHSKYCNHDKSKYGMYGSNHAYYCSGCDQFYKFDPKAKYNALLLSKERNTNK